MKSQKLRKNISPKASVSGITRFGIWILVNGFEYYLNYTEYPWFKKATVDQISNLKFKHNHHLSWPDINVEIELESLIHKEKYPLIYLE